MNFVNFLKRNKKRIILITINIISAIALIFGAFTLGSIIAKNNTELALNSKYNKIIDKYKIEISHYEQKIKDLEEKIEENEIVINDYKKQVEEYKAKELEIKRKSLSNGCNLSKKTYMDYRCISRNSKQGNIVYGEKAWTDENGLRRYGDYYCVAMGTYYGNVGDVLRISTDLGNEYLVILGDIKSDNHTDSEHKYTVHNGCMLEFIVDSGKISNSVKVSGSVNGVSGIGGRIVGVGKP